MSELRRLRQAIRELHGCDAKHLRSTPIREIFNGQVVWDGVVEEFEIDHGQAQTAYAWSYVADGGGRKFVAVLGVPPINCAQDAVRAAVVAQIKRQGASPSHTGLVYRMPGPRDAAYTVQLLDVLSTDKLVGLGIVARGYEGDPEEWFVYANLEGATDEELRHARQSLGEVGTPTTLTLHGLLNDDPKPHFAATGPVEQIMLVLQAQYGDQLSEGGGGS